MLNPHCLLCLVSICISIVFVFHTFQDDVVHFELLVKSVDGVANTLMLQPTATLSIARVTLMIISLKLDLYYEHN